MRLDWFLAEVVPFVIQDWRQGRPEPLDQLAGFAGTLLSGPSDELREIARRSFVDRAGGWAASAQLDQVMQSWPEVVRVAVERSRRQRIEVTDGVRADLSYAGSERVSFEWTVAGPVEAMLLHDGVLYTVGEEVKAVDAAGGQLRWRCDGEPQASSGGIEISVVDGEVLEVFAPFEYRVRLDLLSGAELSWSSDVGAGRDRPRPSPTKHVLGDVTIRWPNYGRVEVSDASGETLVALVSDHPSFDPADPLASDDLLILPLSSGDVAALRVRPSHEEGSSAGPPERRPW